jgi:hypothetical protein
LNSIQIELKINGMQIGFLKKSKFARECGVGKKGFENTHIKKDTFHIFLFENGLNMFQFGIFCHLKE